MYTSQKMNNTWEHIELKSGPTHFSALNHRHSGTYPRIKYLAPPAVCLLMAACGGSSSSTSSSSQTASVDFALSDAPAEGLTAVVVTVDSMTLTTSDGEDIVIDDFYNSADPSSPLAQIQINLLEYQGSDYSTITQDLELSVGTYQNLTLDILDDETTDTYAEESDGAIKPIKVPSDTLRLDGFTVSESNDQTYIIEFDLRQSMTHNPGPDRYILKPRGVRIVEANASSTITGTVDLAYYNALEPCASKTDSEAGNVLYLYEGHDLDPTLLADQLDPDLGSNQISNELVPYSSITVDNLGQYELAFVEPGNYSLIFSCTAEDDDPDTFDNLTIPAPDDAMTEIELVAGESTVVNFPEI